MKNRHKENGKKENRTSRKRSFIMYGILALVVISVAAASVQIIPGGSDNSSAAGGTWDGSGTQADPYQISDAADLKLLADKVNDDVIAFDDTYFILTNDIYLNVAPYNEGSGWVPIGDVNDHDFNGIFDGCGHTVAGLFIDDTSYDNTGLFGLIDSGGVVKNLAVENVSINGGLWVGGVAGYCYGAIENCYVTGSITAQQWVGGIVGGTFFNSTVENCYFGFSASDTITGSDYVGGVVGSNSGNVHNCYSLGTITVAPASSTAYVGGVIGHNVTGATVTNCFFREESILSTLNGVGDPASDTGATPTLNVLMETQSTFTNAGWDFTQTGTIYQTWFMYSFTQHPVHRTHPMLSWQIADSGIGTSDDPYIITTIQQLANIQLFTNTGTSNGVYWQLGKDLDLSDYLATYGLGYNSGAGWVPIGNSALLAFRGNFDGGGHTITGLFIDSTNGYLGMFGSISGGYVKNLGLVNVSVEGGSSYVGGMVGHSSGYTTIENCFITGSVKGTISVGGFAGYSNGTIINCYNTSSVEGSNQYIGGIVGYDTGGGTVLNCYNMGEIKGGQNVGGLVGGLFSGVVRNCYNAGAVSGTSTLGGVIGFHSNGTVNFCFYLNEGDINKDLNGLGNRPPDNNAVGISSEEMSTQNTFPAFDPNTGRGWDFSDSGPWGMYLNNNDPNELGYGYPYIKTIENFILVTPDGGSMVYDGKSAPEPPGWKPVPSGNIKDSHPISVTLAYDPTPVVDIGKYGITLVSMDGPYYQLRFKNDVQFTITAPPPPKSYTITPTSDANSTITPSKAVTVQSGSSYTFTYSAASGYHISSVIVNGIPLDQALITGSYTFTNVLYNQTIEVKSASGAGTSGGGTGTSVTLTVDIVGGNGMAEYRIGSGQYVTFTGTQQITVGSNLYVSIITDSGYSFVEWSGASTSKNAEVNFANVTSDIHLVAHLSNDNATGSAGKNGNFAVLNLVLAILALIIGFVAIVAGVRKNAEGKASVTAAVAGLFSLIVGIISIIVFFLTEDISAPMITTDNWTVWMAVLFVVAVIFAAISFWLSKRNDS